jgi:hypothetical protein
VKPLDCVGTDTGVGKHDFQPVGPVVHAPVERRTLESQARYYSEKIAELVMTQSELRRVVAERDAATKESNALADALRAIEAGELPSGKLVDPAAQQFAAETLVRLASGELRKPA